VASIANTRDLADYLAGQSAAVRPFAGGLADSLETIAAALRSIEPIKVTDLRKIPQLVEAAALAKRELAEVKQAHREEMQRLKQEQKGVESAGRGARTAPAKDLVPAEVVRDFEADRVAFVGACREQAALLDERGASVVERVRKLGDDLAARQAIPATRLAARLLALVELGGLQSMQDSRPWLRHRLTPLPVERQAREILDVAKREGIDTDGIKAASRLFVGTVPKGARAAIENALVAETLKRASTR